MTAFSSRIWTPRSDTCHQTPFQTGVDRALADAFPPLDEAALPNRIEAALVRLDRALREIPYDPRGVREPPVAAWSESQ